MSRYYALRMESSFPKSTQHVLQRFQEAETHSLRFELELRKIVSIGEFNSK